MAYTQKEYTESEAVQQARSALEQQNTSKPGEYQSQWQPQLNDTIDKILNRKDFSYDLNGDALYQQYKDRYTQLGKTAMMDTMGQAATLTGGYGNSYAQVAGQQAYQGYLQGLNDKIPELYQLALDRYTQQGQDLYSRAGLLSNQEQQDYGRHQDAMSAWNQERSWLSDQYNTERSYDYGQHRDQVGDDQWAAQNDQQAWENAFRLYQLGIKTPEVLEILGIPQETSSGGGDDDGGSGRSSRKTSKKAMTVEETYMAAKQNGASGRELDSYLKEAIAGRAISKKAATDLREKRY